MIFPLSPMLLGSSAPFDSPHFIFEPKFDGMRALAYLEKDKTTLISRNGNDYSAAFPELSLLHKQVSSPCVLDGEVVVITEHGVSFLTLAKRFGQKDLSKNIFLGRAHPASFAAFDILYIDGVDITAKPLVERKQVLADTVKENDVLSLAPFIENFGKEFFALAEQNNLEGIVAKEKNSAYLVGKRSNVWLKIKSSNYIRN